MYSPVAPATAMIFFAILAIEKNLIATTASQFVRQGSPYIAYYSGELSLVIPLLCRPVTFWSCGLSEKTVEDEDKGQLLCMEGISRAWLSGDCAWSVTNKSCRSSQFDWSPISNLPRRHFSAPK